MLDSTVGSRALWFLGTLVKIRVSYEDGRDEISVLEHRAPFGDSPPLHIHHTEDEVFVLVEGSMKVVVGHKESTEEAGSILLAPKGVPHTYRVESKEGARWLTITRAKDFERLVRALSRPAERDSLPPAARHPTPEQEKALAEACKRHGIELVGPPLH